MWRRFLKQKRILHSLTPIIQLTFLASTFPQLEFIPQAWPSKSSRGDFASRAGDRDVRTIVRTTALFPQAVLRTVENIPQPLQKRWPIEEPTGAFVETTQAIKQKVIWFVS